MSVSQTWQANKFVRSDRTGEAYIRIPSFASRSLRYFGFQHSKARKCLQCLCDQEQRGEIFLPRMTGQLGIGKCHAQRLDTVYMNTKADYVFVTLTYVNKYFWKKRISSCLDSGKNPVSIRNTSIKSI